MNCADIHVPLIELCTTAHQVAWGLIYDTLKWHF